jgi:xanthine dehydrogenase/oxidase
MLGNGTLFHLTYGYFESAYKCPNYTIRPYLLKTNKPACVEVRCPDLFPSICVTENVMQHVAETLGRDPLQIRQLNFFKRDDSNVNGHKLAYLDIENIVNEVKVSSEYEKRKSEIDAFNKQNKYAGFNLRTHRSILYSIEFIHS